MKIIVKKVHSDYEASALHYLLERLRKFRLSDFPSTQEFAQTVESLANREVPLVSPEEFPTLSARRTARIEKTKACARNTLDSDYPLLPGETAEKEFFSYLSTSFEGEAAGTCVLCQRTNFAIVYFFFDNARIEGDRIRYVTPATIVSSPRVAPIPIVGGIVTNLALSLAKGLLTGIGEQVGALICNRIFEDTGMRYFEPTEEMIKRIVHEEVTTTMVNEIDGMINGTTEWIRERYTPDKEFYERTHDQSTFEDMKNKLNQRSDEIYTTARGPLEGDQFAKAGFPVYLIACGVQISLNQELALIDKRVTNPFESPYAKTVRALADNCSTFAKDIYDQIKNDRLSMIYWKRGKSCCGASGYPVCSEYYYWMDKYTNETREFAPNKETTMDKAKSECIDSYNQHCKEAQVQLNSDLGDPDSILPLWQKLRDQPIPPLTD